MKFARTLEQEDKKQWTKDQVMIHTHGCDNEVVDETLGM